MTPTTTGIYSLRLPSGRVVRRKCIAMNDALMVVMPCGGPWLFVLLFGWLLTTAVPLDLVEGEWVYGEDQLYTEQS